MTRFKGPFREFKPGETVMARYYRSGPRWVEGTVLEQTGPVSYTVSVNNAVRRQHADQDQWTRSQGRRRPRQLQRQFRHLSRADVNITESDHTIAGITPVTSNHSTTVAQQPGRGETRSTTASTGSDGIPFQGGGNSSTWTPTTRSGRRVRTPKKLQDYHVTAQETLV